MGVATTLEQRPLAVEPGMTVTLQVSVVNTGSIVDAINLVVLGEPGGWATVTPDIVRALPGDSHQVTVTFAPPRSSAIAAGTKPFAVRAVSHEDAAGSSVAESVIEVLPFRDLALELIPRTRHANRRAVFEYAIDNRGNVPVEFDVAAIDPEQALKLRAHPPVVVAAPGTAAFGRAVATVPRFFLRGADRAFPFRVAARTGDDSPLLADATLMQRALIPRWAPKALLALLLGLLALVGLYRLLLRPLVGDTARSAAKAEIAKPENNVGDAIKDAADAKEAANAALGAAGVAANNSKAAADSADQAKKDAAPAKGFGEAIDELKKTVTTLQTKTSSLQSQIDELKQKPSAPAGFEQQALELHTSLDTKETGVDTASFADFKDGVFYLTDLVVLNPTELQLPVTANQPLAGQGTVTISGGLKGDATIVQLGLSNFRDVDYHFVSSIKLIDNGVDKYPLKLTVECTVPPCHVLVKASGLIEKGP